MKLKETFETLDQAMEWIHAEIVFHPDYKSVTVKTGEAIDSPFIVVIKI